MNEDQTPTEKVTASLENESDNFLTNPERGDSDENEWDSEGDHSDGEDEETFDPLDLPDAE